MKSIIKLTIALAAMLLPAANLKAQSLDPYNNYAYFNPSVESWQMTRYGNLTPSMYTGAMQFSLPLYTYADPDFTIPVTLDYSFDGFRPGQHSGTVGYGWFLNCGGTITREVRGLPDEGDISGQAGGFVGWRDPRNYRTLNGDHYYLYGSCANGRSYTGATEGLNLMLSYDIFSDSPVFVSPVHLNADPYKYDPAPDIYHFSFLGHSGDFMTMADGRVRVFNSDLPHGELKVEFCGTGMYHSITITTGDGTVFTFGGTDGMEYSTARDLYGPDPGLSPGRSITAYKLVSIEAPNRRRVSFSYSPFNTISVSPRFDPIKKGAYVCHGMDESECSEGIIDENNDLKWSLCEESSLKLSGISISGGAAISFSYSSSGVPNEFAMSHHDAGTLIQTYLSGYSERLTGMSVTNASGQTVESAALTHDYAQSGTPKMFLSSVSTLRGGTHSFSYNLSGYTLPNNDTQGTDHWGYWNGQNISDLRQHLRNVCSNSYSSHLYDQITDSVKEADPHYASCGALSDISYPTGGSTHIVYEGNTVRRRLNHYVDSRTPVLEAVSSAGSASTWAVGGVRVKRLSDRDADGQEVSFREYDYCDNDSGLCSGVLMTMPRYSDVADYVHGTNSGQDTAGISCAVSQRVTGFSSCCGFQLSRDSHIAYPQVKVTYPDGSYDVQSFTSIDDYADVHSVINSFEKHTINASDQITRHGIGSPTNLCLPPVTSDRHSMRGKPKERLSYDAQGNLVAMEQNSYSSYSAYIPEMYVNNIFTYDKVSYSAFSPRLTRTVRTENGVTVTTDTEYNALGQVQMQTASSQVNSPEEGVSSGELTQTTRVRTRYLHESSPSTPLLSAADAIVVTDVSASGREKIVSAQSCTYGTGGNPFPLSVTAYESLGETLPAVEGRDGIFSRALGGSGRTISYGYDNLFRPVNVTLPGSETLTYTWQNGVRVTQKTQGTAANRTLFQWKDLVGLSSLGTPDGQRQSYVYDDRNRLKRISDRNGKPVTRYNYKMKNESTTSNQ